MKAPMKILLCTLLVSATAAEELVETMSKSELRRVFLQAKHFALKKDYRRLKKQDGAIKLVGGERPAEGNVEILHKGRWGNVCDDEWDEMEARVVCKQLGYTSGRAKPTYDAFFGQARRRYWMTNLLCEGNERELARCRFNGWGQVHCKASEAAGVSCEDDSDGKTTIEGRASNVSFNQTKRKSRIGDSPRGGVALRLVAGSFRQGRVELRFADSDWAAVCGDGWSLREAAVVCRQLGLGFAAQAYQSNVFGAARVPMAASGINCRGDERQLAECSHDTVLDCPGVGENVAGVTCTQRIADLVLDHTELERTAHLEDRPLYNLQCAMEENCVASQAYRSQRENRDWHWESRRLLRFTARVLNLGSADFRPALPKHLWEWHMCHMHYHSMEVFATFDIIDSKGRRVAEGHKASFCLEDNQCLPGIWPRYRCAHYGDQGISVNCSDIYRHNIDCQWIDITELAPGSYTLKVAVNPEAKVGEMSFDNNAATCKLLYAETFAKVHSCVMGRP
ncbi:lysyl oxidase homolog 3A isoform X2 [Phymastichus coffea]|uniref:lysyl oxidase homolog 3A isoform X2 n=1 Tax=Phymastichus coffea TaxID=108790 RepID=UPI00273CD4FB|nr:lysyl oxidase homolog 3A isoform X2 [Phymastichus coffea]